MEFWRQNFSYRLYIMHNKLQTKPSYSYSAFLFIFKNLIITCVNNLDLYEDDWIAKDYKLNSWGPEAKLSKTIQIVRFFDS